jgi:hypothetical protein
MTMIKVAMLRWSPKARRDAARARATRSLDAAAPPTNWATFRGVVSTYLASLQMSVSLFRCQPAQSRDDEHEAERQGDGDDGDQ